MYRTMFSKWILSLAGVAALCLAATDAHAQRRGGGGRSGGSRGGSTYRGGGSYNGGGYNRGYYGGGYNRGYYGGGFYPGIGIGVGLGGYGYGGYGGYGGYSNGGYYNPGVVYADNVDTFSSPQYIYSNPTLSDYSGVPAYAYGTNPSPILSTPDQGIQQATFIDNGTTFSSNGFAPLPNNATPAPFNGTVNTTPMSTNSVARIEVKVPADAKVWFNSLETTTTGTTRLFESPPLQPGHKYAYEFKAQWNENGKTVSKTRQIDVFAGAKLQVEFTSVGTSNQDVSNR